MQRDPIGHLEWGIEMAIDLSAETRIERYDRGQAAAERAQQRQTEAARGRGAARWGGDDSPEHRAFLEQECEIRAAASRRGPCRSRSQTSPRPVRRTPPRWPG
ncbi:hypothetical protein DOU14_15390 [Clavibacter michiganensis subsp. michiganensis]|nr:hypothetical protein [Clavibacter michiganensis subsp. michiganensis]MWJ68887.1 hypothetical protein [Clavibacter michiganensis subsp. michiganensis]